MILSAEKLLAQPIERGKWRVVDPRLWDTYGKRQRLLREDLGWTQEDLSNRLEKAGVKVGQGYMSVIERTGRIPSGEVVAATAKILGTNPAFLLLMTDDSAPVGQQATNDEPTYSEAVERAADMLQAMDEDTRGLLLHNIEVVYGWDQERKELHQDFYDFLNMAQPDPVRKSGLTARLRRGHRSPNAS